MLVDAVDDLWYHINAGSYVAVLDADTVNINDARVFLSERSLPAN